MQNGRAGGYISKITFNDGKELKINKNDIVVFVGPNNAGKSQSLKDIYSLAERKSHRTVITDISITKYQASLMSLLNNISNGIDQGNCISYKVLGNNIYLYDSSESTFKQTKEYEEFRNLFVLNLNTENRLEICTPPQNISRDDPKTHPIHFAAFGRSYRKWLSDSFKRAFGIELTPNTQFGARIPLCMGAPVKFTEDFDDEQDRQEEYAAVLETYKQVQDQGDGIKSFTGILLYLMLNHYCTYLIDEPESFLHPPQAKIMGEIIGATLKDDQQAFISTHSEDILKGLLETCPERVKIIRITREADTNFFSFLNNDTFREVWNDPLLRYSNIMSSLFHKSVVLCESDADCKMYSVIENHIKQKVGKYSEALFIHCSGKHRMAKIAKALRSLNVDVKLIPDMDILNDKIVLKTVTEACGVEWKSIQKDYNTIVGNLHSPVERIDRNAARITIQQIFNTSQSPNLSTKEIEGIRNAVKTISKWESIKKSGKAAIPQGEATLAYGRIEQLLREYWIFIVPVGEIENFVKEVGKHGPEWVNTVLERYPDLDDLVYNQITSFISNLNL